MKEEKSHKERWAGWELVVSKSGSTYLGKRVPDQDPTLNCYQPCIRIVEQFPVVPGEGGPVILPVVALVTIGMFVSPDVRQYVDVCEVVYMSDEHVTEEMLEPYSKAYDQMMEQSRRNEEAKRHKKAAITTPSGDDIARFGKGGDGACH